jgi:hypothetical protein
MISLAYFSSAALPMAPDELGGLLEQARAKNSRLEVTGLLCHYDGSFLQFLEGPEETIDPLFDRIARDPRHISVLTVHRATVSSRAFPDWSMGLVAPREVSVAQQALARSLRQIEIAPDAENRAALAGLLGTFRSWLR